MAPFLPHESLRLPRLARLVDVARSQGMVPPVLSVLDGWQGHLPVQVTWPGEPSWIRVSLERGEQISGPSGLPPTRSRACAGHARCGLCPGGVPGSAGHYRVTAVIACRSAVQAPVLAQCGIGGADS